MNIFCAYRGVTSKAFRIIYTAFALIVSGFGTWICLSGDTAENYGTAMTIIMSLLGWLFIFADYFVLQGIAVRPQKGMSFLKSSFAGKDLIIGAIFADWLIQGIITLIADLGMLTVVLVIKRGLIPWDVLYYLSVWMIVNAGITLIKLLARRFAKGMTGFIIYSYLGASVTGGAVAILVYFLRLEKESILISMAITVVALLIMLFSVIFSKKEYEKSYDLGFIDELRKD